MSWLDNLILGKPEPDPDKELEELIKDERDKGDEKQ